MKTITTLAAIFAAFALSACKEATTSSNAEAVAPDAALEKYFSEEAIADAKSISEVRSTVKPGDEISLSGRVMGREKVFVEGRAAFILGDPKTLTPCNEMEEPDHCPTPWDVCCGDKEVIRDGIASIQIVGENGRVLAADLKGVNGLKELSTLTVSGIVDKASTPDNLVVNVTKIRIEK